MEANRINVNRKYWDIFILILSIYVLVELAVEIVHPFSEATINIVNRIDFVICCIFLGDFFFFLIKSPNKKNYLKNHWIDFVASIPFMSFLRAFRLVRVIRLVRFLRGAKALIVIFRMLGTSKLQNILISYIVIVSLVMLYCSLAFYAFEKGINANVNNYFDAFWWAFVSLTTIGYGDIYPVTTEGRIVGMLLALAGIGLFSVITANLATAFFKIQEKEQEKKGL